MEVVWGELSMRITDRKGRSNQGKEYKEEHKKLGAIWGVGWKPNTIETSYNIYIYDVNQNSIATYQEKQIPNGTSLISAGNGLHLMEF